ncbi:MAG: trehalose-phosphatase [Acidimicrobiales bacterium]
MSDAELDEALRRLANADVVLVASDYDGTLAELVDDPARAWPWAPSIEVLRELSALPGVHVAIVSGRALDELRSLSRLGDRAVLIGSHGAELVDGVVEGFDHDAAETLATVTSMLEAVAGKVPGARVETKPAGVAFHTRAVDPEVAGEVQASVLTGVGAMSGVRVRPGKDVLEFGVTRGDKGRALARLRDELAAAAVLFIGDDLTDEDAFGVLDGPLDVSVKVGQGPTAAHHRVAGVPEVGQLLARVLELRAAACRPDS